MTPGDGVRHGACGLLGGQDLRDPDLQRGLEPLLGGEVAPARVGAVRDEELVHQLEVVDHPVGHPGCAQGGETVRLRREGVLAIFRIGLQEAGGAGDADAVAVVDATACDASSAFDSELSPK